MCVVRISCFEALRDLIATRVPELAGKIKIGQQPANVDQTYPTLTITAAKLPFEPQQEDVHATIGDPADGVVVYNVGDFIGAVQLRIVATSPSERYLLEQKVQNVFFARAGSPGVIVVEVTACPDLDDFIASFELESTQWIDVAAADRKYESAITTNAIIPALVTRTDEYEIDDLVLGFTTDFATSFVSDTMQPPKVEVVLVNEDGTIEPYTP